MKDIDARNQEYRSFRLVVSLAGEYQIEKRIKQKMQKHFANFIYFEEEFRSLEEEEYAETDNEEPPLA